MNDIGTVQKMALSIAEFATAMGIGRNKAVALIKQPDFPSIRMGGRVVIPVEQLKEWLAKQSESKQEA